MQRGMITNMDLKVYMNNLKNNPRMTEEMLRLVEEDLRFGLTPKETEEYTAGKLNYQQMKVYSRCLRGGYGKEVMEVITKEGLSGEQMEVALEFYEKGVPLHTIKEVTGQTEQTAFKMRKLFVSIMKKLEETQKTADTGEQYTKELLEQIKEVVAKIEFQEKRYDILNDKLKELQTAGQDVKVQNNLLSQLAEKDSLLEKQQNEINEAGAAIARLRNELDTMGKEKIALEKEIAKMGRQKNTVKQLGQSGEQCQGTGSHAEIKTLQTDNGEMPEDPIERSLFQTEYQAALVDGNGRVIHMVPAECTVSKMRGNGLTAMLSRICFKKKTDIVRLVAEKGLEPGQLVQIRKAIEKGLTEKQLMVLINREIPAEQMEEIINIAVYENRQMGEV